MRTARSGRARALILIAVVCGLLAGVPIVTTSAADAQQDRTSARSVVRITCRQPGGNLIASGFVWPDPTHVVTALHAAAGCTSLLVWSEATKTETPATVERVILEADLAWLTLKRPLGLQPLQPATSPLDTRARFVTWGYPDGVPTMIDVPTTFAGGLTGGPTTLGEAFGGVQGLSELVSGSSPVLRTSIIRVTSTLQHGQSGGPILDDQGKVVAIVDGGLLEGFRSLNWSIPAATYLRALPASTDPRPTTAPTWTRGLLSAFVPTTRKAVTVPSSAGYARPRTLTRTRTVPLSELGARLRRDGNPSGNIDFIRQQVGPKAFAKLTFDIYEDRTTLATLGVPSGLSLEWAADVGALQVATPSGNARLTIGVLPGRSHAEVLVSARKAFIDKLVPMASWITSPTTFSFGNSAPDVEYANWADFYPGRSASGRPVTLLLSMTVQGRQLLGYGVFGPSDAATLPRDDLVSYLMMQLAAQELSGFAAR